MRFDGNRRATGKGHRFNDIGVKCPLGQKLGIAHGSRMFLEHVNKEPSNDLALGFGV